MRKLFTETEERLYRTLLQVGWVVFPVTLLLFYCLFVADLGWYGYLFIIPTTICAFSCFLWCRRLQKYRHRLKGSDRMQFMYYYYRLWGCTCILKGNHQSDCIVKIVIYIKRMADIMEGNFSEVREFVCQHAGTFLDVPKGLPLRLPDVLQCGLILKVLELDAKELPMYITHRDELVRKTAVYRLTHEKAT